MWSTRSVPGLVVWLFFAACSSSADSASAPGGAQDGGGSTPDGGGTSEGGPTGDALAPPGGPGLAAKYPGDVGLEKDPAVVWVEGFEEGSVDAFAARYQSVNNKPGMQLVTAVPSKSVGKSALQLTASGDGANATDFYAKFPKGYDEWFVRWYVKYQPGPVKWHHVGVWFGGYDPPTSWPNPQAGLKPNGDDRIGISVEPVFDSGSGAARFDFYNYWMQMRSWMAQPSGNTAYYGNALVNKKGFTVDEGQWVCLEVHVKLNTDLSSTNGGALEVWKNDVLVRSLTDAGPKGYWTRDKFCTADSDGPECTQYPAAFDTQADLQLRKTSTLQLNNFWPQNYITDAGQTGWVQFDDMVVATQRVGCLQ